MGEYLELYIDWTDAAVDVSAGLREKDGRITSVRFAHKNGMVRIHADDAAQAMLTVARSGMPLALGAAERADIARYLLP
jgi:hypothetical protein